MTDRPDDQLGEALRGEVPAPGAGYWEAIDARLEAAAAETAPDQVIHLDHLEANPDTTDTVVRLTGMNTQSPSPTRNLVLALAAVAALVAGIAGFAALRNDTPTTVDFTDDPSEAAPDVDADADDTSTDPPEHSTPAPNDEASTDDAPNVGDEPNLGQIAVAGSCFYEQYLPEDDPDPTVVWVIAIEDGTIRSLIESEGPDGTTNRTFDVGTIDSDGNGTTAAGVRIEFYDGGASRIDGEFEPFTAAEVDCDEVADVGGLFARLAEGPLDEDVPFHVSLIGLTEEDAEAAANAAGRAWRVVERDGESLLVELDRNPGRINAVVQDGIVTRVTLG